MAVFECVRCGRCCLEYGWSVSATPEDLERWMREGREDILKMARILIKNGKPVAADLWFNPQTRREYIYCPWLKKTGDRYTCLIHDTRPQACRDYICRRHVKK